MFFVAPAQADDISDAQVALDAANALVVDLTIQDDQAAVLVTSSQQEVLSAQATVDATDIAVTDAIQAVADAQLAYDTQLITQITHTENGLTATVYNDMGYNNAPPLGAGVINSVQQVAQINFQWGGGNILGTNLYEDTQIKFEGTLTVPETNTYQFYGPADDGFILKINGNTIINDWRDKGGGGTMSQPIFLTANQPNNIEAWYYENGGGAWVQLNWLTGQGWQVVPASAFGTSTVVETNDPNLLLVLEDAQDKYDIAMLNNSTAIDNLNAAISVYNAALSAKELAYSNLQVALAAIPDLQDNLSKVIEAKRVADLLAQQAEQARLDAIAAQEAADKAAAEAKALADAKAKAEAEAYAAQQAYLAEQARLAEEKAAQEAADAQAKANAEAKAAAQEAAKQEADRLAAEKAAEEQAAKDAAKATEEPVINPKEDVTSIETVDLKALDPQELTDKQVEQLVDAATEVLASSEQGSPEYEKALEALYVAAQADDIELPAELAAIPLLGDVAGAALEVFNNIGNVGADMAPVVREKAEKTVIATVIAAGAAINAVQSATAAAASAAISSGASGTTGGSSGGSSSGSSARRKE